MDDKIKWFGRYLNNWCICLKSDGSRYRFFLTASNISEVGNNKDHVEKLNLKELKDISKEDYKELVEYCHGGSVKDLDLALTEYIGHYNNLNGLNLSDACNEIDFLRSKGYAIGIPKKYYMTQSELKEDSK